MVVEVGVLMVGVDMVSGTGSASTLGSGADTDDGDGLRRDSSKDTSVSVAQRDRIDLIEGARSKDAGGAAGTCKDDATSVSSVTSDDSLDSEGE